jgi:hypothetical protein
MRTTALWLAALLLCASPALAQMTLGPIEGHSVDRFILAQPQAEVLRVCEEATGEPAFWCVTWLADAAGNPVCIMRVPTMLEQMNLERYEEVLGELREQCGQRVASR